VLIADLIPRPIGAILIALALVVPQFACSADDKTQSLGGLAEFVEAFQECGDIECATVSVPRDYESESLETVELSLYRRIGSDKQASQRPLFVHPGGPGADVKAVVEDIARIFPTAIEKFTVIGLSTRGSSDNAAAVCSGSLRDLVQAQTDVNAAKRYADSCVTSSESLVGVASTRASVEDLENLRKLLGYDSVMFLGWSYGATLGAALAMNYPESVQRAVLDAPADPLQAPRDFFTQRQLAQSKNIESIAAECSNSPQCELSPNTLERIQNLLASDVENSASLAIERMLYDSDSQSLFAALLQAEQGSWSQVKAIANERLGHISTNDTDGAMSSQVVVRCSDVSHEEAKQVMRIQQSAVPAQRLLGLGASIDSVCTKLSETKLPLTGTTISPQARQAKVLVIASSDDSVVPANSSQSLSIRMTWSFLQVDQRRHLAVGYESTATDAALKCLALDDCSAEK